MFWIFKSHGVLEARQRVYMSISHPTDSLHIKVRIQTINIGCQSVGRTLWTLKYLWFFTMSEQRGHVTPISDTLKWSLNNVSRCSISDTEPPLSELNIINYFLKSKNARRVTKFMWPLKPVPGQARGQLILNSRVPLYQVTLGMREESMGSTRDQCSASRAFSSLQQLLHRAFEQKLYYFAFYSHLWAKLNV